MFKFKKKEADYKTGEDIKGLYSSLGRSVFLCFVALFSIAVATAAWFVSNSNVRSTNAPVSANGENRFYLATIKGDTQGIYDSGNYLYNALQHFDRIDYETVQGLPKLEIGTSTIVGTDEIEYFVGGGDNISLMVTSTSNVNNINNYDYIGPGSRGKLTFYIIPAIEGNNAVNITLTLKPYELADSGNNIINAQQLNNETVSNLLCGRIFLFKEKNKDGDYINLIEPVIATDGAIDFSFVSTADWTINKPIPITIYWVWPYRFESILYSGQMDSIFKTDNAANKLLEWINQHKENVAYTNDNLNDAEISMSNADYLKWSNAYNRGDQYVGDRVVYFVWTICAEA